MKRFITHKLIALLGGLLLATAVQATPFQLVHQLLPSFALLGPEMVDPGQGNKYRNGKDDLGLLGPVVIDPGQGSKHRNGKDGPNLHPMLVDPGQGNKYRVNR